MSSTAIKMGGSSLKGAGRVAARPRTQEPDLSKYSGRVAKRIEAARSELGISVIDLAKKMGEQGYKIETPTLYHWLGGNRPPHLDALPIIARILRVKLHDLLPPK